METACSVSWILRPPSFDGKQLPNDTVLDPIMKVVFGKAVAGMVMRKELNFSFKINQSSDEICQPKPRQPKPLQTFMDIYSLKRGNNGATENEKVMSVMGRK